MSKIAKIGSRIIAFAALLALGGMEAQAQEWPTTLQRNCDWTRTNTGQPTFGGKAKVTLSYTYSDPYVRRGTMTTEYPAGGVNVVNFDLYWDWMASYHDFSLRTSTGVDCRVKTFESGTIIAYETCFGSGFQSFQYCQ